jgi:hypothetical protein
MSSDRPSRDAGDSASHRRHKQWLTQWERVGPALEAERTAELQALTEEDAARIAVDMVMGPSVDQSNLLQCVVSSAPRPARDHAGRHLDQVGRSPAVAFLLRPLCGGHKPAGNLPLT